MPKHPERSSTDKIDKTKEDMRIQVLKELSASGGLAQNRIALEMLYLLPQVFIEQYTTLFFEALREDAKGTDLEARAGEMTSKVRKTKIKVSDRRRNEAGELEGAVARGAQGEGTKRYRNAWVIRNEKALKLKTDIDRKLRLLSVEIATGLKPEGRVEGTRRCQGAGCGRYLKNEWRYCPSCGSKT
jgi:hypothetical protein